MGADQILVRQFQTRRRHRSGNHVFRTLEEVLVVRTPCGAVRKDKGRLPAATCTSTALRVVSRSRRDIPHVDDVEFRNVHAEFHRWGAEEDGQLTVAET